MNNETVQTGASIGQRNELATVLTQSIPADISADDAQAIIGSKKSFKNDILAVFAKHSVKPLKKAIYEWQQFYSEMFGDEYDFSKVRIPERREGFDRLIIVAPSMTSQRVYDRCADEFNCWKYTSVSLDEALSTNERDPENGAYAIWVRDVVEADEIHKNKSAKQIAVSKLATETLLERLLHELKFYKETGHHLDINKVTLCAGSRDSDGDVPCVSWFGVKLSVYWCDPGDASVKLRAREVAS